MDQSRSTLSGELAVTLSEADLGRLVRLVTDMAAKEDCSAGEAVDRIEARLGKARDVKAPAALGRFVDKVRRLRMRRNALLGAQLFRDPAWDMLLDLYASHGKSDRVSVSALCEGSGVPLSTAFRHVERLEAHGMIERRRDPQDHRREWVHATPRALEAIGQLATRLAELADETAAASDLGGR